MSENPMHNTSLGATEEEAPNAHDLLPWSPSALSILSDERARPAPSAAKDRVLSRITETARLAGLTTTQPAAKSASNISATQPTGAPSSPVAPGSLRLLAPLLGTLLVGLGGGFWLGQTWQKSHQVAHTAISVQSAHVVEDPRITAPSSMRSAVPETVASGVATELSLGSANAPASHTSSAALPTTHAVGVRAPSPTLAATSAPSPSIADDALMQERGLLDRATLALRRGNPTDALAAIAEHKNRFPGGQFAEERDALEVHALRQAGKIWEAGTAETTFHKRYPKSALVPEHP